MKNSFKKIISAVITFVFVMSLAFFLVACTSLTEITIPRSVIILGEQVFNGCTNLEYIYCKIDKATTQTNTEWNWAEDWKLGCDAIVAWG